MPTLTANSSPDLIAPRSAPHLGVLDGVRGAAAFYVLLHHAWLQAGLGFYLFGHFAVGLFITLSGFCLMLPVVQADGELRGGTGGFFRRRARRILPPYYAALLLSLGVGWLTAVYPLTRPAEALPSQTSIFAHLLLLQDALPGLLLIANGALWTISVEWRIYFLFPLLVRGWSYIGAWATTLITVGVSVALFLLLQQTELNVEMHGISPQFLGLFVMGMLAATVAFSPAPQMKPLRTQVPFFAVFGLLSVVLVVLAKVRPWTVHYTDYIVGIWASCLLIEVTTRQKGLLARFFGWKPLIWIGTFAYSLYLIHMALLRLMWQYVVFPLGLSNFPTFLVLLVGGVPLIVLAAYGFFCLAERPFLRRRATTEAQGKRPAERPPDSVPEPARNAPETHG